MLYAGSPLKMAIATPERTYMRHTRTLQLTVSMIILFAFLFSACTVKKISEMESEEEGEYSTWTKSGKGFDAVKYVDSIWDERLIPAYEQESTELSVVIDAIEKNKEEAITSHGLLSETGEHKPIFKVKGSARVVDYDDSSRNGLLILDLVSTEEEEEIPMQVGPVIRETAIRDSVTFIKFTEVGNQIQFANLATELNNRMKETAVKKLDLENIGGKVISFYGVFQLGEEDTAEDVVVTPVKIDVEDN